MIAPKWRLGMRPALLCLLLAALLLGACRPRTPEPTPTPSPQPTQTRRPTQTETPERGPTPTPRRTRAPTSTPGGSPTPESPGVEVTPPTQTPPALPSESPTLTPPPTVIVDLGVNLLTNGNLASGFSGWQQVNDHWLLHGPLCFDGTPPEFAEMDRDVRSGWEVGWEDWLWQDVHVPESHKTVIFSMMEAHHMHSGQAEVRIYGSDDGQNWEEIFFRPRPEAERGAGHKCTPVPVWTYAIPSDHAYYRVEIYGRMNEEGDGWLIGALHLSVQ